MEQLVDSVAAVGLHHTAVSALGMFLNRISRVAEQHTRLDEFNRLVQTLS